MREIEFRGKRIDNGEWVYGSLTQIGDCADILVYYPEEKEGIYHCINNNTIGQFTGLTDKNGKKIFEGDILKCLDLDGDDYLSHIRYEDGAFVIDVRDFDFDCTAIGWAFSGHLDDVEIIGNIHDNPELLKGGEE